MYRNLPSDLVAGQIGGQPEVFAVPRESLIGAAVATAVRDELPERVDVVERVRLSVRESRMKFVNATNLDRKSGVA
jgi:hypothetical protein